MPQLSLYIDKTTLEKIEIAAKLEQTSISKYVVRKINESMSKSWPENYQDLYGSITDESFQPIRTKDFSDDIPRQSL